MHRKFPVRIQWRCWFTVAAAGLLGLGVSPASAASSVKSVAKEHLSADGESMPYRLAVPRGYDAQQQQPYPLVLFLHGAGLRGDHNPVSRTQAYLELTSSKIQKDTPVFVLTPQCPNGQQWVDTPWAAGSYDLDDVPISAPLSQALAILDAVLDEYRIDPARVYVAGQSMGGYGTWDLLMRHPDRFAAGVAVCGAGDPSRADVLAEKPIWVFHGLRDNIVPPAGSDEMVAALREAGSEAVRYTTYPDVAHESWKPAWREPEIVSWLLSQRLPGASQAAEAVKTAEACANCETCRASENHGKSQIEQESE